jgi:hypothetical protein
MGRLEISVEDRWTTVVDLNVSASLILAKAIRCLTDDFIRAQRRLYWIITRYCISTAWL